ncbi:MAG: hypothetical protein IJ530_11280 [Treponema sp.]|uniref:hypothetical protein n=1 Tax=Treponema sp. TaxID=166 RepID=UPI0025EBF453|nr:hypothetical protein [Treponema sp.]MBQ8680330.1 hypothetical protein [Treponema sp.]
MRTKRKKSWLDIFEDKPDADSRQMADGQDEEWTLKETVRRFIRDFKYKPMQFQIIWTVRILCWIFILGVALFGVVTRITHIFK